MVDDLERGLDKHLAEEQAYDEWYERNEADLADEFYEKYGVEAFDLPKWESFKQSRWMTRNDQ